MHELTNVYSGYSQCHKGYKVWDIDTNTVLHSRDVIFHEDVFPYESPPTPSVSLPLVQPTDMMDSPHISLPNLLPSTSDSCDVLPSITLPSLTPSSVSNPAPTNLYIPPPRRSQRESKQPAWLNDYVCHCTCNSDSACIPSTFSPAHISFVALLSSLQEPRTYYQASKDDKWVEAMNQELTALEKNDTWDLVELPPGKKAIGSRGYSNSNLILMGVFNGTKHDW
ncbi:UNVERIFIED_CONTAM: hypothetical protein Sangu_0683800 [Sesamum angustifolium]|uniref:Retroviral polymerase SH3-like domain-containing protein n=1 Tax=Sesamum angustifolium TaxID=2727405 RepID=A0AAW2PTL0_9LAMI